MPLPSPVLRSPPFPWVDPAVAAVSQPGRSRFDDPGRVIDALRAAGVEGEWWSPDAPATEQRAPDTVAALEAATYRDPFSGAAIDIFAAIAILGDWRRVIEANRSITAIVGMAGWKRAAIAQFLWDGTASPPCLGPDAALERAVKTGGSIAYWPSRVPDDFADRAASAGVATWPVEDGFLRSTGLGAECRPPMSVQVDRTGGVHFDPARPNALENILADHPFDAALLTRAADLRATIVAGRIGKYGVDPGGALPPLPADRRIVLAIGQVEDDLSVLRGSSGIAGLRGFLARVRAVEPEAYIVYRPHPDVVAGLRRGDRDGGAAVDQVAIGGSLLALVERADAVHVLSSLTGFEALLRGKPVTVHGVPFYSGWGLTTDLAPQPPRRGRAVSLDALVAAALILAPRYRDPVTELPCGPETLVARMIESPAPVTTLLTGFRRALGVTRRALAPAERRRA